MTYTTVEECVARMEAGFWRRYRASPELQQKLAGKTRIIHLKLDGGDAWTFRVDDGKLQTPVSGAPEKADIVVETTKKDLLAVFNGELKALQAYLTGRVKVRAPFSDILFAKSLLGA